MAVKIKTFDYFFFSIGGYFDGYNVLIMQNDHFEIIKGGYNHLNKYPEPTTELDQNLKRELIAVLNEIQVTKWEKTYDSEVLDGTQWELEIKYNDRKTNKLVFGSNEYPYVKDAENGIILSKTLNPKPDFVILLTILNKIVGKRNFFY